MKRILASIILTLCTTACSSPPTPKTILRPDVTKPIVVGGCEKAKQRETGNVDC